MKRQEFIKNLKSELFGIPMVDIEDIIRDQEEMINDALKAGRTEDSIIQSFGDPKELARSLKAEIKIEKAGDEKKLSKQVRGVFGAVGALLVLAPFNLIFVLGPFLAVLGVTFAGWTVAVTMGAVAIGLLGAFLLEFLFIGTALTVQLSTFFTFLGFIGLAALFVVGMYYVTKIVFKLILSYLRWNLNFIQNQTQPGV